MLATRCGQVLLQFNTSPADDDSMDSSMDESNSASLPPADMKPDISQLSIGTSAGPFAGLVGMSSSSRYLGMGPSYGYGGLQHNPSSIRNGMFSMIPGVSDVSPIGGAGNPMRSPVGGNPMQSPSMHSQSSMSPGGSMTDSPSSFMNLQSPSSTMGPPYMPPSGLQSHGAHFSMSAKHLCAICGDRASGKHYGVYSCEGCKGFFKRTVRKDLQYACRDEKCCLIDKRQRNRCQYCRYMKCLNTGMKREAVQEERQRAREKGEVEVESTTCASNDMPVDMIHDAELSVDAHLDTGIDNPFDVIGSIYQAADLLIYSLVDWAKRIPHFTELNLLDQVTLLKTGWNELLIAGFAHQSTTVKDRVILVSGLNLSRENAQHAGLQNIFDRVLLEIVSKMREMLIDKTELGCMRAIVLFNPDAKGLTYPHQVESLREKVYASLEDYCRHQNPDEPGRFAKLLLRLPALRSIGLKCNEHLFYFKMNDEVPIDTFLQDLLENPNPSN